MLQKEDRIYGLQGPGNRLSLKIRSFKRRPVRTRSERRGEFLLDGEKSAGVGRIKGEENGDAQEMTGVADGLGSEWPRRENIATSYDLRKTPGDPREKGTCRLSRSGQLLTGDERSEPNEHTHCDLWNTVSELRKGKFSNELNREKLVRQSSPRSPQAPTRPRYADGQQVQKKKRVKGQANAP